MSDNSFSEHNAVALARIEERLVAIQTELARQGKDAIPNGKARMTEAEQTNRRQWASVATISVVLAAITGERIIPLIM